jgi:GNAT superfamily N-acetyltransferase
MPGRASYRTTFLLCGFVILGWGWDFVLGGGLVHSIAWLLALIVVGGISALSVHGAQLKEAENPEPTQGKTESRRVVNSEIRTAVPAEYEQLIEVETAADRLFPLAGYGETPPPADIEDLVTATLLLVAGDPPVGYARVEVVDGQAHLEGLSVRPRFMRQGIGSALVNAACDWATEQGFEQITLCTFAEVPWNGPFYATLGFAELIDLTPGLAKLRAHEVELGLDAMGPRVVLVRELK